MSRSYKKNAVGKCAPVYAKWEKSHANRLYRRCEDITELRAGKSAHHRKYTESWDIHDCVYRWTRREAEQMWEREEREIANGTVPARNVCRWHYYYRTKERFLNYWKKSMLRK